ncbi:hypothetical protein Terro_3430 [Terriglobus roseus DSM 18391]|uniref:Uncharacterized protein n=1 Tax=Terriglobus roseus (strain DSM 18391 / NRRL B-41598 / KBS 63) TaxID=926566 RepID=I3ZK77_TERRK|nr:hypothetical protein [Terriglobus roseus]AFL89645.1 hypothetical protein Terro_3430 [Terriglobus roseus DSM 18391]
MRVTIEVSDAIIAQAAAAGMSPEAYAEQRIREHMAREAAAAQPKTEAEMRNFVDAMTRYSDSIPASPRGTYSREEIYSDRD